MQRKKLIIAVGIAALLWFFMFSPWTAGLVNFWIAMSCSAVVLTIVAVKFSGDLSFLKIEKPLFQLFAGIGIAAALWGVFWLGDKISSLIFSFARLSVDAVYSMKTGSSPEIIGILLFCLIGPAEELFWRGYVQRNAEGFFKNNQRTGAFLLTAIVYAMVHIWSFNFMLILAALVAGLVWGFIYRMKPGLLPALILSHALWDVLVFVIFPI